jgi:hypothetical protein
MGELRPKTLDSRWLAISHNDGHQKRFEVELMGDTKATKLQLMRYAALMCSCLSPTDVTADAFSLLNQLYFFAANLDRPQRSERNSSIMEAEERGGGGERRGGSQ